MSSIFSSLKPYYICKGPEGDDLNMAADQIWYKWGVYNNPHGILQLSGDVLICVGEKEALFHYH